MRQDQNFVYKSEFLLLDGGGRASTKASQLTEYITTASLSADVPPDPAAAAHPKRLTDDGRRALAAFARRMRSLAVAEAGRQNA
jgi:hypothetical protein